MTHVEPQHSEEESGDLPYLLSRSDNHKSERRTPSRGKKMAIRQDINNIMSQMWLLHDNWDDGKDIRENEELDSLLKDAYKSIELVTETLLKLKQARK